jgi:hypothetical protein
LFCHGQSANEVGVWTISFRLNLKIDTQIVAASMAGSVIMMAMIVIANVR